MTDWSRIASLYDLQLWLERAALNAAIDMAAIESDDRLLDLGTGTAALLRQLGRRRIEPEEAIGVDSSPEMLARARALPPGSRLLEADATKLPFPNQDFDVVCAIYLLHLLDPAERAAVLAEARRVIRLDGRLVVVTVAPPRSRMLRRALGPATRLARSRSATMLGLRPLDPRSDLEASGFVVCGRRYVVSGYPSMVTMAKPNGVVPNPSAR